MAGARGAYRAVLRVREARALIGASAASRLGDWLFNAALLTYVYDATTSAAWVGAATIFRLLPYVMPGPLAARPDKRAVLLAGEQLRCASMLAVAAVVAAEGHVAFVIALASLASAAGSAERAAAVALLPRLVGESRLGPAGALLRTVRDLGVVAGPALGAVLLAQTADSVPFVVTAGCFAVSVVLLARLRSRAPAPRTAADGARARLVRGLRSARSTRYVMPLLLVVATAAFILGAQTVQLVLYADRSFGVGAAGFGYLLAAFGAGALLSALGDGRLAAGTPTSAAVIVTGALLCATQLVYAATGDTVLALLTAALGGAGFVACKVVTETALARVVPGEELGGVLGVMDAVSVAAMALGALVAPVVLELTTLTSSLVVLGTAALLVTLACLTGLRGLNALARERARELASRVAVLARLPIATGVPLPVLEQLAAASQLCPLPPGVDVVVEGAPAHAFYAVIDGTVVVHRDGEELARLGPGSHFGERGLLDTAPRNATVTTADDGEILRLEGEVLLEALGAAPTMRSALERLRPTDPAASVPRPLVDDPRWARA